MNTLLNTFRRTLFSRVLTGAVALLVLAAGAAVVSCSRGGGTDTPAAAATIWYCPMHPTVTSDRPGDCPICHMRLVPLEPRHETPPSPSGPGSSAPAAGGASGSASPPGWSEITLSTERIQQSGVTFGTVATKRMTRTLSTSGRVAYDETRLHHVHTRLAGWIEHLHPVSIGDPVRRGDPLFDLYAPELLAAQEEYLQALKAEHALAGPDGGGTKAGASSSGPDLARAAAALREAARRRLELWDFGPEDIARLEASGRASRTVTIRAPVSGVVSARVAAHGLYADPAVDLYTIADLSRVWVLADVYENELTLVRPGGPVEVRLTYAPGRVFRGRIALVPPTLDPATRTAKVRIEIDNASLAFKPDMFADVAIATDAGPRTVVPKSAVVQSGERAIVFVDRGNGRLAPRQIAVGLRFEDDLEVLSGLSPGERIVTSAAFVIDSESRLRASVGAAAAGATAPPAAGHAEHAP